MEANLIFILIFHSVLVFIMVRILTAEGRTLIMDPEGLTVKFFWYQKHYKWDELKVKRVDYIKNFRLYALPFHMRNVVFAPHRIYKPGRWHAENYSVLFHPLSVIYIYIFPKKLYDELKHPGAEAYFSYVMLEELFFEKMEEWGVELELMKKPNKIL